MEVYSLKRPGEDMFRAVSPPKNNLQGSKVKPDEQPEKNKIKENEPNKIVQPTTNFPKLMEIAQQVSEKLKNAGVNIQFEVNEELQRVIIKVMDPVSGELIREIPPEAYLKTVELIDDTSKILKMEGIEVDVRY